MVKIALLIILACGFLFNGRVFGQSFPAGSSNPTIEKVSGDRFKKKNRAHKHGSSKKSKKLAHKAK